ncbi:hypothetical protein NLJ89_g9338 [Agrocybe chaxingu]|uniref:Protein kinase domain-containing protein n=1 Tax=Agrocybe chaxingu TaxID=84603 RepID=A0A9W8JTJ5_9AGAR|nr:hypothetical protein NLJ89_g9338 [Agrocybe chaxingu]
MPTAKSLFPSASNLIIIPSPLLPATFPGMLRAPGASQDDRSTLKAVVSGHIQGSVFSLKFTEPVTHLKAVLKWAQTDDRDTTSIEMLRNEASIYMRELLSLQGTVVPRCYGYYEGTTSDGRTRFAGLLLEELPRKPQENWTRAAEYHRHLMIAFCKIHKAGIQHHGVMDPRHFITDGGSAPKIVSFSLATRHNCAGCPPADSAGNIPQGAAVCLELQLLEMHYGSKTVEREELDGRTSRLAKWERLGYRLIPDAF